jgi:N-methylhydantoinase A
MRTVLVPPLAGVLSALGLAIAAERREAVASVMRPASELTDAELRALADALATRAGAGGTRRWWLRARYAGQGHELEVPVTPGEAGPLVAQRFVELHERRYGFVLDRPVEVVSARHAASGGARDVRLVRRGDAGWDPEAMVDAGGAIDATVHGRAAIALRDATLLVAEGWTARPLDVGGWIVERDA